MILQGSARTQCLRCSLRRLGGQVWEVAAIGPMLRPEVRYARPADDVTIGYWVGRDGPVRMVVVSPLTGKSLPWSISGAVAPSRPAGPASRLTAAPGPSPHHLPGFAAARLAGTHSRISR